MRIFWIVLIVIIAGTGFLVFSENDSPTPTPALQTAAPATQTQDAPASSESSTQASPAQTAPSEIVRDTAEELIEDAPALADTDEAEAPIVEDTVSEIASEVADEESAEAEIVEADELTIVDLTAEDIAEATEEADAAATNVSDASTEAATENVDEAVTGWDALAESTDEAATETIPEEASTEEAPAVVNLSITETEDGKVLVGDAFTITGKGTKEAPYILPWDFLVTIRQAYSPREGKKDIPEHFAFFDGKYISIAGYLQFPLASPEPTECLVMLNQWDGCCIGVPPTPYDAIEVALSTPATQAQKFAVEGRIVGKLKIDPYLVGNWLIGLYLIGDATVDVSGTRSAEEVYGNTPSQFLPGQ